MEPSRTGVLRHYITRSADVKRGGAAGRNAVESVSFAILNEGRGSNVKYLPHPFTEHDAIQAANVLNSPRAIEMGVYVVRAFVRPRNLLASNAAFARKLDELERKYPQHDDAIKAILSAIRELINPPQPKHRPIGFTAKARRITRLRVCTPDPGPIASSVFR